MKSIKHFFEKIDNELKLSEYLKITNNEYCKFILQKKAENSSINDRIEIHHIIPLHAGGPKSESWNQIELSFDDHTQAHHLLASCYDSDFDSYVTLWRSGLTKSARRKQREYANSKSVFKDVNMQSKFGKKGGSVWNTNRLNASINRQSVFIQQAFSNGMIWYVKSKNNFLQVNPGQFDLVTVFISYLTGFSLKTFSEATIKNTLPNSVSKVLSGQTIDVLGEFYLVGIFTEPLKNSRLTTYYQKFLAKSGSFLKYSTSMIEKAKPSDSVPNLSYTTVWYNKKNDLTVEIPPVKNVNQLIIQLNNSTKGSYSVPNGKQIGTLIRGGWIDRTRDGWTLKQIKTPD